MRLRSFVVDDRINTFDIETTRGKISGEEERGLSVTECFYTFDTLKLLVNETLIAGEKHTCS